MIPFTLTLVMLLHWLISPNFVQSKPSQSENGGCEDDQLKCSLTDECLEKKFLCNGVKDCPLGEDEDNCTISICRKDSFTCESDKRCIPLTLRCDGFNNCYDESDEKDCYYKKCPASKFGCRTASASICIASYLDCYICFDIRDEDDCQKYFTPPKTTSSPNIDYSEEDWAFSVQSKLTPDKIESRNLDDIFFNAQPWLNVLMILILIVLVVILNVATYHWVDDYWMNRKAKSRGVKVANMANSFKPSIMEQFDGIKKNGPIII